MLSPYMRSSEKSQSFLVSSPSIPGHGKETAILGSRIALTTEIGAAFVKSYLSEVFRAER